MGVCENGVPQLGEAPWRAQKEIRGYHPCVGWLESVLGVLLALGVL